MLDDTLPLTPPEWPEWGNPIATQDDLRDYRAPIRPMTRSRPRTIRTSSRSPASPIRGSPIGSRPNGWRSCANMKTDDNLLLLKTNMGAGHGGASGRFDRLKEVAFVYAFGLMVTGKADAA